MDSYQQIQRFYQSVQTEKRIYGKSSFGRDLTAIKLGAGEPVGIAQYAIHGREWITSLLAIEHFSVGLQKGSCWILPMTNPDGCLLSEVGLSSAPLEQREKLLRWNGGEDFSLWKANGRGVDLNVNFDARWGECVYNVRKAGAENYIGETPFSELETQALKKFTEEISPKYTVSFHTKGEEIYWYFSQIEGSRAYQRDKRLAETLSKTTGYPIKNTFGSVGGYKDWCIEKLGISAFTVEAGADSFSHPLGRDALENVKAHNQKVLYELSKVIEDG